MGTVTPTHCIRRLLYEIIDHPQQNNGAIPVPFRVSEQSFEPREHCGAQIVSQLLSEVCSKGVQHQSQCRKMRTQLRCTQVKM